MPLHLAIVVVWQACNTICTLVLLGMCLLSHKEGAESCMHVSGRQRGPFQGQDHNPIQEADDSLL